LSPQKLIVQMVPWSPRSPETTLVETQLLETPQTVAA